MTYTKLLFCSITDAICNCPYTSLLKGVDAYCACKHPLKAIVLGIDEKGKKQIKFDSTAFDTGWYHGKYITEENRLPLPCGQCTSCRIQRSREWANRCMMELESHDSAYFVTLTYAPGNAPVPFDPETGECKDWFTLEKKDFQLFMKRLRKEFSNDKIRFFACGEYGDTTARPHYHAILYGLHLDDLEFYKSSPLGFSYYNSPRLEKVWKYGYAVVTQVTWETCAYVARYVLKKRNGKEASYYSDLWIQPEFVLMSRKPGIGREYYEKHRGIYDFNYINLATEKGGIQFAPPRYFDKLYEIENPEGFKDLKLKRQKVSTVTEKSKLAQTSLTRDEMLAVEERSFEKKISALRRSLE